MWHPCRPTTLQGLFDLKAKYNDAKLIVGNTEVGIEMKFKSMAYPHLVGVTHIEELNRIEVRAAQNLNRLAPTAFAKS